MARVSLPFSNKSYSGRTRVASLERTVNLFPEVNPVITSNQRGATTFVLIGAPGNRPYLDLPDNTDVVHLYSANNTLIAFTRKGVYNITGGEIRVVYSGDIGQHVSAAHGVSIDNSGYRILYLWWTDGGRSFIANITKNTSKSLATDSNFLPATSTVFLDGYALFSRRATDTFFWSDLLDFDQFNGLNFAAAEGFPDNITKLISFERELWIVGNETTEIWQNTGDANSPFQRIGNAYIEIGSPYPETIVKLTRDLYMIGYDLKVYRSAAKSYRLQRISEHQGIENDLAKYGAKGAFGFGYTMEGHDFYCVTLPAADRTWVFDESTSQWHERFTLVNGFPKDCHGCFDEAYGRHFINSAVTHEGVTYSGGKGHVYIMDLDYGKDGDEQIMREAVSGPIDLGTDEVSFNSVELEFQNTCESGCKDKVSLFSTDDQSKTWNFHGERSLFGGTGYWPLWNQIGTGKSRSLRWRTFTDQQVVFRRSNMEIEGAGRGN